MNITKLVSIHRTSEALPMIMGWASEVRLKASKNLRARVAFPRGGSRGHPTRGKASLCENIFARTLSGKASERRSGFRAHRASQAKAWRSEIKSEQKCLSLRSFCERRVSWVPTRAKASPRENIFARTLSGKASERRSGFRATAFTLIETIIAMVVIITTIIAAASLVIASIRGNTMNINRLKAYYLAQEGLEGIRNMRDSNWMQNYAWNGGENVDENYGYDLTPDPRDNIKYYAIKRDTNPGSPPWKIAARHSNLGIFKKVLCGDPNQECSIELQNIKFLRYIKIEYTDDNTDIMQITSIVEWQEYGRDKKIELYTELTDWKKGPL